MKDVETKALSITADYITRLDEISFIVRTGMKVYPICLETEATMPSCECRPLRKTHMPCKHFAAIFRHVDDVSFSSLCDIYTANPIFNLDGDLFNKSDNTLACFLNEDNSMEGLGEVKQTDDNLHCEPPSSSLLTGIEASSKKVRELLSKIHNLSFLI
ncbi:hypothetical protein DPMN_036898 [Dreissena polymorpha]|uniref:SWIM-type domain-containing protein n=1 Tax=Dreissena polymorpha TaxID=45954 RepID=A0A9D4RLV8_DREPO|nr:hypothetical protein DPMN_036898 [Dreissena polymorpha]